MENRNGGALFVAKKEKPTQPDFYGTGDFKGVQFRISGWTNVSRTGTRYQRLIFTEIVPFDTNEIGSELQVTTEIPENNQQAVDDFDKNNIYATSVQATAKMPPISNDQELADDLPF